MVKNENIEKFIWDYGDWVVEERDALVPGHKYTTAWEYIIKLKVITTSWKQYSTSKSLVLKPKSQSAKISTSMEKAPVWQWIDFTSEESEWQIVWYFWNFWDWSTSTEANPTHIYNKAWNFTISLKLDFANRNILEDTIDLEITEE
jgi:microbial collagenase